MPSIPKSEGVHMLVNTLASRHSNQMPLRELAQHFEASQRTIKRWAATANQLFDNGGTEPLIKRVRCNGGVSLRLTYEPLSISPHLFHYAAVYLATRQLEALGEVGLRESGSQVLDALAEAPNGADLDLQRLRRAVHYLPFGPKQYSDTQNDMLDTLLFSSLYKYRVEATYRALGREPRALRLDPYTIVVYRDGLYVVGRHGREDHHRIGVFALDRFASVERTNETFEIPDDYTPEAYFSEGIGIWRGTDCEDVRLALTESAARNARERSWPGFSHWTTRPDGRYELALEIPVTPEVKAWIASWGPTIEVLEPAWLRDEMIEQLEATLQQYTAARAR